MDVRFQNTSPERLKTDLLVLPITEKELGQPSLRVLDRRLKGALADRIKKAKFTGGEGSVLLHATNGVLPAAYVLLVGLGKGEELEAHTWRKAAARARKEAAAIGGTEFVFSLAAARDLNDAAAAVTEGILLASYQFNKYRSEPKHPAELRLVTLARAGLKKSVALERAVRMPQDLIPGVFLARDLVNEPPSSTTPRYLGEQAERHCRGRGVRVEVWGKKKIEAMKLAGLLAVNRGSAEEPRFIMIRYQPPVRAKKRVALIGKGITFDSGGLSLKPAKSMETMKLDMSGAAAIIGAMSVIDKLSPAVEVKAYIPCTDNLPSGSAQKPGDVIRYLNGKTAEVLNTDAEGRLILADGLALAAKDKPDCMVDLATLTGACMVALGTDIAGIFGNNQPLVEEVIRSAREGGERLWQLPLVKEYKEEIKSSVADIKNIGGSYGGAITAALFLQEFVGVCPWVHLDIAGPAFAEKEMLTCPKGGTGFGVLTLLRFLSRIGQHRSD